jgi:hypothetical protein
MKEPARITRAAHAKKRAMGLPMELAFQSRIMSSPEDRVSRNGLCVALDEFNNAFC